MDNEKMKTIQLYVTESLHTLLRRQFGEGKMSANVERIIRLYLSDPDMEKKAALAELQKRVRAFNGVWGMRFELIEEELPPAPPTEAKT